MSVFGVRAGAGRGTLEPLMERLAFDQLGNHVAGFGRLAGRYSLCGQAQRIAALVQQPRDSFAEIYVVLAGCCEIRAPILRRKFKSRMEELPDALPAFGIHRKGA